jgi:phosphoglycerate kinase
MRFGIRTIDELDLADKKVLLRVDINQPVDQATGVLKDLTRIKASVPTIKELRDRGAALVVLAHQGSDIEYKNFHSLAPHAEALSDLLGAKVDFVEDVCGPAAQAAIGLLPPRRILLLENVRYLAEEQTLFENSLKLSPERQAKTWLIKKLAPLADFYVGDAFAAAHRDQPSLCGFCEVLPSAMGRLFEREYCEIASLMEAPARPSVFVLGGSKIADAFAMLGAVLSAGSADLVLSGGLVALILAWAGGADVGDRCRDFLTKEGHEPLLAGARELLAKYPDKIVLPSDYAWAEGDRRVEAEAGELAGAPSPTDIGRATAQSYRKMILEAKTVFVNGPMGVFESAPTAHGTEVVWQALGDTPGHAVLGGGDSIAAANKFGQTERLGYVCTGGGALIRFLSGEELPVVRSLRRGSLLTGKRLEALRP